MLYEEPVERSPPQFERASDIDSLTFITMVDVCLPQDHARHT
ncbi:MAG: hypothetical protein AAGD25_33715 [Cyanobacteria bacterium P01_F01_bin.150]